MNGTVQSDQRLGHKALLGLCRCHSPELCGVEAFGQVIPVNSESQLHAFKSQPVAWFNAVADIFNAKTYTQITQGTRERQIVFEYDKMRNFSTPREIASVRVDGAAETYDTHNSPSSVQSLISITLCAAALCDIMASPDALPGRKN